LLERGVRPWRNRRALHGSRLGSSSAPLARVNPERGQGGSFNLRQKTPLPKRSWSLSRRQTRRRRRAWLLHFGGQR
jgi:hypothetical protein